MNILVELTEDRTIEQIDSFRQILENADYVKEGSIRYVDQERAAEAQYTGDMWGAIGGFGSSMLGAAGNIDS